MWACAKANVNKEGAFAGKWYSTVGATTVYSDYIILDLCMRHSTASLCLLLLSQPLK